MAKASARKNRRHPRWPYVVVVDHGNQAIGLSKTRTEVLRGYAFASREEAVLFAAETIERRLADLQRRLADPRYRALREHHGMSREIAEWVL